MKDVNIINLKNKSKMNNRSKTSGMWGAVIWLGYIAYMWIKKGGVKSSVSALFNYIEGSYLRRRIIIGVIYVSAALFLARAIYLLDISTITSIIGIIGTAGLAGAGLIPDSKDSKGSFSSLKDKLHVISTLVAIICSMIYITWSSIIIGNYWLLLIPGIAIAATVYMLKKKSKEPYYLD